MQARILGPFQLDEGGRRIPVGGVRQRAVLVSLVLYANKVVPSEQLLMELWGEDSPRSAANSSGGDLPIAADASRRPPANQGTGLCAADLPGRAGRQPV